jgi:MFS family permease
MTERALPPLLRALAHRNFRLFFFGQGVSLVGTWMQQTAMSWLVYRLSGSPLLLGLVMFAAQIPVFAVSPLAGVLTDRWNRRRTVLVTQSAAMVHATVLTVLAFTGLVTVWQLVVLAAILGLINAFDMPTRQAFLVDMVDDRAHLGNAIALNSSMFNGAKLIGPALAGLVIWAVPGRGEATCFLLNGLSYAAVLAALLAMRISRPRAVPPTNGILGGLMEGFHYAFGFPPIRTILSLVALVSLASMPLFVLLPVLAGDVLHGNAATLGLLTAASGLGALAGGLSLAMKKTVLGLGKLMALTTALLGAATIGVAFSHWLPVSALLLALTGFAMMVEMASGNTILQTIVEEDKRGRVMSLYTAAFMGLAPAGSILAGVLASAMGTPKTLAAAGLVCLLGAAVFAAKLPGLRRSIRPIYIQAGILPEISSAIESAVELTVPPEG